MSLPLVEASTARLLNLSDGQVVQGTVQAQGDQLALLLRGRLLELPPGMEWTIGQRLNLRAQTNPDGSLTLNRCPRRGRAKPLATRRVERPLPVRHPARRPLRVGPDRPAPLRQARAPTRQGRSASKPAPKHRHPAYLRARCTPPPHRQPGRQARLHSRKPPQHPARRLLLRPCQCRVSPGPQPAAVPSPGRPSVRRTRALRLWRPAM